MIDVSAALNNPDICQSFIAQRTTGAWKSGRFAQGAPVPVPLSGSVQVADPKTLEQVPEGDRVTGARVFYSTAPIYETRPEGTSDILVHGGQQYRVAKVWDWSANGYWKAFAVRISGI